MSESHEIHAEKARPSTNLQDDTVTKEEVQTYDNVLDEKALGNTKSVGLAVIDQTHTIPTTGTRKVTTKWEYWTYCAFCRLVSMLDIFRC